MRPGCQPVLMTIITSSRSMSNTNDAERGPHGTHSLSHLACYPFCLCSFPNLLDLLFGLSRTGQLSLLIITVSASADE